MLAEIGEIRHRREAITLRKVGYRPVGGLDVGEHTLCLAVKKPLLYRCLEMLFKLALERGHWHVQKCGKMLDVSDVLVVAHHELLKFAVEAEQRVEEFCKIVLVIVRQHQQKQFLLFNVEINTIGYSVVHAGNH